MTLHYCEAGGYVVAADVPMSTDPADYQAGAAILGCGNLRCAGCGEVVRQRAGINCPKGKKYLKRLFETDDWTTLDFVKPYGPGRLYACRCTAWIERSWHACSVADPEPTDQSLPWKCDGHPVATLPLVVDGVTITAQTDFRALVRRVLGGWSPDASPPPGPWSPTAWLNRVRRRLADLPDSQRVAEATADCLTDPARRGGALAYFCGFPRDCGFEHVLALAGEPGALFRRTPDIVKQGSTYDYWPAMALRCRLYAVRGDLDPLDCIALQLLQDALMRGEVEIRREDLDAVRCVAAPWLAAHAGAIAKANPAHTIAVLESLKDLNQPSLIVIAGVALAAEAAADHVALRDWLAHWSNRSEAYALVINEALERECAGPKHA